MKKSIVLLLVSLLLVAGLTGCGKKKEKVDPAALLEQNASELWSAANYALSSESVYDYVHDNATDGAYVVSVKDIINGSDVFSESIKDTLGEDVLGDMKSVTMGSNMGQDVIVVFKNEACKVYAGSESDMNEMSPNGTYFN